MRANRNVERELTGGDGVWAVVHDGGGGPLELQCLLEVGPGGRGVR